MLFSHSERLPREDWVISGMNEGQSLGQACLRIWGVSQVRHFSAPAQTTHLHENEVKLVQVALLPAHASLIARDLDSDLHNEVADASLLVGRQSLPSGLDELLEDLERDELGASAGCPLQLAYLGVDVRRRLEDRRDTLPRIWVVLELGEDLLSLLLLRRVSD